MAYAAFGADGPVELGLPTLPPACVRTLAPAGVLPEADLDRPGAKARIEMALAETQHPRVTQAIRAKLATIDAQHDKLVFVR